MKRFLIILVPALFAVLNSGAAEPAGQAAVIGRRIFQDTGLSTPPGQGCISCHDPNAAFADPRPVSPGAVEGKKGIRNAPSVMYTALIPSMLFDDILTPDGEFLWAWEGGLFQDGRANDLFAQVQQPFFDPNEMNIPNEAALAARLRKADYAGAMRSWMGDAAWKDDGLVTYHAFRALVEFLKEPMFRPFDARIDDYLAGDKKALSLEEQRGLVVFKETGKCADCHFLTPTSWDEALLSDYGYDNLGAPSRGEKDPGLASHTREPEDLGKFRAPSLRNVALTAPYMHNGSIATLQEVMEFYNKRDLEPDRWGPTDYPETVNHEDLGNLELDDQQVRDLTALMNAFTDRSLLNKKKDAIFPDVPPGVPSTAEKNLYFPDWTHQLHPAYPRAPKRSR